jgi:hypothetical protein
LVEDDALIAPQTVSAFEESGAVVVGSAASVHGALALVSENARLNGAVLDINLKGEKVYPVAAVLADSGVPFVFATRCSRAEIPRRHVAVPRFGKIPDPQRVAQALFS